MKFPEIGAVDIGITNIVLPHLQSAYGRICTARIYRPMSALGSLLYLKMVSELFKDPSTTLDLILQGFEAEFSDPTVANNVIHTTPKLSETSSDVRKLLRLSSRLLH